MLLELLSLGVPALGLPNLLSMDRLPGHPMLPTEPSQLCSWRRSQTCVSSWKSASYTREETNAISWKSRFLRRLSIWIVLSPRSRPTCLLARDSPIVRKKQPCKSNTAMKGMFRSSKPIVVEGSFVFGATLGCYRFYGMIDELPMEALCLAFHFVYPVPSFASQAVCTFTGLSLNVTYVSSFIFTGRRLICTSRAKVNIGTVVDLLSPMIVAINSTSVA